MLGFLATILDFILIQKILFQFSIFFFVGIPLLALGGYFRTKARLEVKRAGFQNLIGTARLQIVENHELITDGLYKHLRHPLYLGELLRNFGIALIFSSLYGTIFMIIGSFFLLFRINIEERMLVEQFGEQYKEYQKRTKRIIPFLY